MKTNTLIRIHESSLGGIDLPPSDNRYDLAKGELYNPKIWGLVSRKGYSYSTQNISERLKEAQRCLVYLGHDKNEARTHPDDAFGVICDPYIDDKGEMRAKTFKWNINHKFNESFKWWLTNAPDKVGFSVDCNGKLEQDPRNNQISAVTTKLNSFDIVCDPATTGSLLESMNMNMEEMLGQLSASIVTDTSMTVADKKAKLMQLLKMLDDSTEQVSNTEGEPTEEAAMQESAKSKVNWIKKLRESYIATSNKLKEVTRLQEASSKLPPHFITVTLKKMLMNAATETEVQEIIADQLKLQESLKSQLIPVNKTTPVSSTPDTVVAKTEDSKKEWSKEERKKKMEEIYG